MGDVRSEGVSVHRPAVGTASRPSGTLLSVPEVPTALRLEGEEKIPTVRLEN